MANEIVCCFNFHANPTTDRRERLGPLAAKGTGDVRGWGGGGQEGNAGRGKNGDVFAAALLAYCSAGNPTMRVGWSRAGRQPSRPTEGGTEPSCELTPVTRLVP